MFSPPAILIYLDRMAGGRGRVAPFQKAAGRPGNKHSLSACLGHNRQRSTYAPPNLHLQPRALTSFPLLPLNARNQVWWLVLAKPKHFNISGKIWKTHVCSLPGRHAINRQSLAKAAKGLQVLTYSCSLMTTLRLPCSYLLLYLVQYHLFSGVTPFSLLFPPSAWAPSSFYTCPTVGAGTEKMKRPEKKRGCMDSSDCFLDSKKTHVQA